MQRRDLSASRNAGKVAADSDLAFIILAALDVSFDHEGMRPQRTSEKSRRGSLGCCLTIGTGLVGAMLERGYQSSSPVASKWSATNCLRRERRYRPHMEEL